jgi:hypothetical protein
MDFAGGRRNGLLGSTISVEFSRLALAWDLGVGELGIDGRQTKANPTA